MSLDIKYSYPHTFFLSIAVITLIFGFYPFYTNNFDFSSMHWTRILIHGILIIISLICLWKGFSLWSDKERKREEFETIKKDTMKLVIVLNQQKLAKNDLTNQIIRLTEDKETIKKDKQKDVERLKEEIQIKEQKIAEMETKLCDLKKDEISKLPDNFSSLALTCSPMSSVSGSTMLPVNSVENSYLSMSSQKKCKICGAQMSYWDIICPKCGFCF